LTIVLSVRLFPVDHCFICSPLKKDEQTNNGQQKKDEQIKQWSTEKRRTDKIMVNRKKDEQIKQWSTEKRRTDKTSFSC
jgi:hypothetical protein